MELPKTEYNENGYSLKPLFSAEEAGNLTRLCQKPKLQIFDELLKIVINRIKIAGTLAQSDILFTVPFHFIGFPSFDPVWLLYLLKAKLDAAGYITIHYPRLQAVYISWHHSVNQLVVPSY